MPIIDEPDILRIKAEHAPKSCSGMIYHTAGLVALAFLVHGMTSQIIIDQFSGMLWSLMPYFASFSAVIAMIVLNQFFPVTFSIIELLFGIVVMIFFTQKAIHDQDFIVNLGLAMILITHSISRFLERAKNNPA